MGDIIKEIKNVNLAHFGMVRRVDDLGRVVIPREVRKRININEGDPLEIFITEDGGIYLKKYESTEEQ